MYMLIVPLGLLVAAILHGRHCAEQPEAQWPKAFKLFAGVAVLFGIGAAWALTLPWDQQAAVSWVVVMFGPFFVLLTIFGLVSAVTEIIVRRRTRRTAGRTDRFE